MIISATALQPYHWTAKPETILAKVSKAKDMLRTLH